MSEGQGIERAASNAPIKTTPAPMRMARPKPVVNVLPKSGCPFTVPDHERPPQVPAVSARKAPSAGILEPTRCDICIPTSCGIDFLRFSSSLLA